MTEPPPKTHFFSRLKGDHISGKASVSQSDYTNFLEIWAKIGAANYFSMLVLYSGLDSAILCDCLNYYFNYFYSLSGLAPLSYVTNASFALSAALFNSRSPFNKSRPLEIEIPSKFIHDLYGLGLRGGFSFLNSNYCTFRHLEVNKTNEVPKHYLKAFTLHDVNGLYASILQQRMSVGKFVFFSKKKNSGQFHDLSQRLMNLDVDFFSEQLHLHDNLFFFVVILSHDNDALFVKQNIEISNFPFYETVNFDQLTKEQVARGKRLHRDPSREPEKLISSLKKNLRTADFSSNLLYVSGFHNIRIRKVIKIVRTKAFPIFSDWLFKLEKAKNKSVSPIITRYLKSCGNSLAGKCHTRLDNLVKSKLCLNRRSFERYTARDNFYDFTFLNENACILNFDMMTITSKNVPAISALTYSSSKCYLWRLFYTLAARFKYFGNYDCRALFSDTDSWSLSLIRRKFSKELDEACEAKADGLSHLPVSSLTSKNMARAYVRSMLPLLDFSCITEDSHIYQTLFANDQNTVKNYKSLSTLRRSRSFYVKDECKNQPMEAFLGASVKQYQLVNKQKTPYMTKTKGLKRVLIKNCVSYKAFLDVAKAEKMPKRVKQFGFKRVQGTIYLTMVNKRILSLFTSKRCFSSRNFRKDSAFGFPLHLKPFL